MENDSFDLQAYAQQENKKFEKERFAISSFIQLMCMLHYIYSKFSQGFIFMLSIYLALINDYDISLQFLVFMNIVFIYFESTTNNYNYKMLSKINEKNFTFLKISFTILFMICIIGKIITSSIIITFFHSSVNFQNNFILCLLTWIILLQSCGGIGIYITLSFYFKTSPYYLEYFTYIMYQLEEIPLSIHKYRFSF